MTLVFSATPASGTALIACPADQFVSITHSAMGSIPLILWNAADRGRARAARNRLEEGEWPVSIREIAKPSDCLPPRQFRNGFSKAPFRRRETPLEAPRHDQAFRGTVSVTVSRGGDYRVTLDESEPGQDRQVDAEVGVKPSSGRAAPNGLGKVPSPRLLAVADLSHPTWLRAWPLPPEMPLVQPKLSRIRSRAGFLLARAVPRQSEGVPRAAITHSWSLVRLE